MIRGIRGATTVRFNEEDEIIKETKRLMEEMAKSNQVNPELISSVFISVTSDITATFPAKALRLIDGWKYVPVMCMPEIDVPGSLEKCIRVMMSVETKLPQDKVNHTYLNEAIQLRPDLTKE
ncbi:chorismate mutase [Saliterribacillus persicus]|uniref:chorismate mutase n=1 Tax=Saliterribacillus persicus TaxID=930114 RepID=A0A368XEL7_9BACI|nr:chorismate mutase [Saliterribacillus persicus]RCW64917.1 chorismate mutase [Saliterribacillus persicus]